MAKSLQQIRDDLLDIVNRSRGVCLCGVGEYCDVCSSFSSSSNLETNIRQYIDSLQEVTQ